MLKTFSFRRPRVTKTLRVVAAVLALAVVAGAFSLYRTLTAGLPDVDRLARYEAPETSRIFASDGTLIATLFDQNRTHVKLQDMSPYVVRALTSIEDSRYFEHGGVDVMGILRALVGNARGGETEQGASTITMQLTRNLFLNDERTVWRKLQEAVLARRIESRFDKDQILELYLNEVYFGSGAYGIDSAASRYFGKEPKDLTAAESAMIAGLLQAPSELSPFEDPEAAKARQLVVLERMKVTGALTPVQYTQAVQEAQGMRFTAKDDVEEEALLKYPYFTSYVIREVSRRYSERLLRRGGLQIYTSLDLDAQRSTEEIVQRILKTSGPSMGADTGAFVVIDNATGHLVAMVGGPGWSRKDRFNRAWQARRQPGSAFKPIVYAAALQAGFSPETDLPDEKIVFFPKTPDAWTPRNSDGAFMGHIPLRTALMFSRNVVAARLLNEVGIGNVTNLAARLGLAGPFPPYLSLALGSGEASPLEMARAFTVFPNRGILREVSPITRILDSEGRLVEDLRSPREERVLSPSTAAAMVEMLRRAVTGGTGTAAAIEDRFVAGKTGTTDSFKDAWFVGFTPRYTAAAWVGNNDNTPMEGVYGGTLPADIWREGMAAVLQGDPPDEDLAKMGLGRPKVVKLCTVSHFVATPGCPGSYDESFRTSFIADRPCPTHGGLAKPKASPSPSPGAGVSPLPSAYPTAAPPAATPDASTEVPMAEPTPPPQVDPSPYPTAQAPPPAAYPTAPPPAEEPEAAPSPVPQESPVVEATPEEIPGTP